MTQHYSTKNFFLQMRIDLLTRYFQERGLFGDLDFTAMKETKPDVLFTAWLELPEKQCNPMDSVFPELAQVISWRSLI